jgi:Polysaccharide pyruvyl transferase.
MNNTFRDAGRAQGQTILLRSGWQTINIGDIAHTPGILRLLEKHLPDANVILWPKSLDRGVEPMLRKRFPRLRIVRDASTWHNPEPRSDDPTIEAAMAEASLWLHGSGSGINESGDLERWRETTGKPYGIFGASIGVVIGVPDQQEPVLPNSVRRILEGAAFVFTRETRSLAAIRQAGIRCQHMEFAPDATFALDLRNEAAARKLLQSAGLEPDRFLCAIPRLRITPYWELLPDGKPHSEEAARKKEVNQKYVASDHEKMRTAITAWVRETGLKVLLCPEMTYQVDLFRPYLYDPLPADVKEKVVPMDRYWLTDEAASVYRQARAVISMECHSPIIANANDRPGIYLRQPEDTWKGQMYPDLGLGAWKLEIHSASGEEIAERLLSVHTQYDEAQAQVRRAAALAASLQSRAMAVVSRTLKAAA